VAYNFVYSLGQHSYDADCNLFLRVFTGDVEEAVRYGQQALEGEIMRWVQRWVRSVAAVGLLNDYTDARMRDADCVGM
jgi:hypothetical protein